uniref:Uncharacterized protein n=1 Tax=Moorena producens (strain JHB) TaxID=1454205 RepID=A0A1D9G4B5_MOOP1
MLARFETFLTKLSPIEKPQLLGFLVLNRGIGNRQSGIGNRESAIGNRQSGIGNRESAIGNQDTCRVGIAENDLY